MLCPTCNNEGRKFGKDRSGAQRFQCVTCKKTFADRAPRPLGEMRLEMPKALQCLQLLLEGMSVRATMRVTGVSRTTILALLVQVGDYCEVMLEDRIHKLPVRDVQVDEVWGFVGMKERQRAKNCPDKDGVGD